MTEASDRTGHVSAPGAGRSPSVGAPAMRPVELAVLRAQFSPAPACYLEWGLGGSTATALLAGAGWVLSVEGDPAWIEAARQDPTASAAEAEGRLRLVHADIGPTGKWGFPVDPGTRERWPGYAAAPWPVLQAAGAWPDLVLVDGRFRVSCCLMVARECLARPDRPPPRLLLHDFDHRRPHYEAMRLAWDETHAAASLRVFRLRPDIDPAALEAGLELHRFDAR